MGRTYLDNGHLLRPTRIGRFLRSFRLHSPRYARETIAETGSMGVGLATKPIIEIGSARNVLVIGLTVAAACLTGCATMKKNHQRDVDFAQFSRWLPGTYDNTAQVKADLQKGVRHPHDAVELAVIPTESIEVGADSFYLQETAADDPLRVLSQRVVVFKETDKGFVEVLYSLNEPMRWRDGPHEPDMFEGLTTRDMKISNGCELVWNRVQTDTDKHAKKPTKEEAKKADETARYEGKNDMKRCQMTSHAVMGLVQVELRGELSSKELALAELQYDADGHLLQGSSDEPFYRFHKIR